MNTTQMKADGLIFRRWHWRMGMTPRHWAGAKLTVTVAVDKAFVGSKAKSAVVALVERLGMAREKVIGLGNSEERRRALSECVSQEAVVNSLSPSIPTFMCLLSI